MCVHFKIVHKLRNSMYCYARCVSMINWYLFGINDHHAVIFFLCLKHISPHMIIFLTIFRIATS